MSKMLRITALLLLVFLMAVPANAKKSRRSRHAKHAPAVNARPVADLDKRLAQWKPYPMSFDERALSPRERQLVEKLVMAARYLEDIYWRQSDPAGLELLQSLERKSDATSKKLTRMLMIMGSRFDLLAENQPFVKGAMFAPGRGLYPQGLTRDEVEQYVKQHPEKSEEIYNGTTVIRHKGDQLVGVPYRVAYRDFLEPAAKELRDAAELSDDAAFAKFLRLRADALLSDNYYESDLAWVDLKDPKFDIIFAPYETYLDDVLGVKGSYGVAVMVRNEAESAKLAVFQKCVPDIQDALPPPADARPSKRGHLTPMEVMDTPYRAGDLRHGYQAVADNLPNDPKIHQEKGTKKIFFKNYMDARVKFVILPIAQRLMPAAQAGKASGEGYMAGTLLHEICHGLGPAFSRQGGKQIDIREAIGPAFSGLEEAKADVVGMFGLKWLIDHGALPKERLEEFYASYVAGIFRTLRFGTGEEHGRAEMMEFNYLLENGALSHGAGRWTVAYD